MKDIKVLDTIQTKENLNHVVAVDEVGSGGAHHAYWICKYDAVCLETDNEIAMATSDIVGKIEFQKGPRNEEDSVSGVIDSDLLEIVRDRLTDFQAGPFACEYNAEALVHVEEALKALNRRVEDRIERQVLGTNNK